MRPSPGFWLRYALGTSQLSRSRPNRRLRCDGEARPKLLTLLFPTPPRSRRRLLDFLGLPAVDGAALPAPEASYAVVHARSLRAAKAQPMLPATRVLAERFYAPHNEALAKLLGDPGLAWPRGSTVVDAAGLT